MSYIQQSSKHVCILLSPVYGYMVKSSWSSLEKGWDSSLHTLAVYCEIQLKYITALHAH